MAPNSSRSTNGPAFVLLLGALTALPPLSIDVSLPGLPAIARALHASTGSVQATLSAFILAFGAGQLLLGPLSDRYGRRPVLLAGLAVFVLAGAACTLAHDAAWLIGARFVQGFGACAGMVNARAIVRDVSADRARAAALQSYVSAVQSLAPILAPLLGAAILALLGWRALYGVLVVAGVLVAVAVSLRLPETSPRVARDVRDAYAHALRLPRVVSLTAFVFCAFFAYFALISASPFVLVAQMRIDSAVFAFAFAANACALLAGAFTGGRLAPRLGPERVFGGAVALLALAGLVAGLTGVLAPSPAPFVASFALVAFAYGCAVPNAYAAALAGAGGEAGLVSGLLGAAQMIGGGAGGVVAGALPWQPAAAVGITAAGGLLAAGAAYLASRRKGIFATQS